MARRDSLSSLVDLLQPDPNAPKPLRLVYGKVAAVSPLTVSGVAGSAQALPAQPLATYSPAAGDVVVCLQVAGDLLIVGQVQGAAGTAWAQVGVTAGAPAFQNGWSTYADANFGGAFYRRVGGVVYLRGLIAGGTASVPAFTLPPGFRPAGNPPVLLFTGYASTGAAYRFDVNSAGGVVPQISAPAWASIACSFPAEQ